MTPNLQKRHEEAKQLLGDRPYHDLLDTLRYNFRGNNNGHIDGSDDEEETDTIISGIVSFC